MSTSILVAGGGTSGGASTGFNGGLLRQAGESERGLFLSTKDADLTWHLQGEERSIADGGTAAKLLFANRDKDANLEITLPLDGKAQPETVNRRSLQYTRYPNPVAEVKAYADFQGLRVSSKRTGSEGDDETLTVNPGLPDRAAVQSFARIPFKRGLTPDTGEFLQITSPGGGEAASGDSRFQSNRTIRYTYFQAGENGNGFAVRYRIGKASSGGGSVTAEYDSETQLTITLLFPSTSTGLAYSVNLSQIVAAVNAARWSGTRLVQASLASADGLVGFVASRNPSAGDSLTPTTPSAARTGLSLSGGVGFTGLGSNIGEVRVSKTGARVAGAKAKATLDVNPDSGTNNIVITAKANGAALNTTPVGCRFQSVAVPSNSVAIIGQSGRVQLAVNGTVTLQAIVDKLNSAAAGTFAAQFTASLGTGESGSTQVTWSSGDSATSATASGGADAVNPLEAVWDNDNHRLVIRAIETDTLLDVRAAITALDEFSDSTVTILNARLTDTIVLPAAIGQFVDYAFGGGSDAQHRSSISFSESSTALIINGVLAGDTVQQVIDRGQSALEFFTLSVKPGSGGTDQFAAFSATSVALANGVDTVARQLPNVVLRDNGQVRISLHAATGAAYNTTLGELEAAFRATTYKKLVGGRTVGFPHDNAEIKSPGVATDLLNNVELPAQATGGVNPVPESGIEALARPDDEVNGPNILVRYHAGHDTLQAILTAINDAGGDVKATPLYDTDLTIDPEEPPFRRGFYFGETEGGTTEGGLDRSAVDARIRALVSPPALSTSAARWVLDKLSTGVATDAEVAAAIQAVKGNVAANFDTLAELATAIEGLNSKVETNKIEVGSAAPSGSITGSFYVRTGDTAPGLYWDNQGTWTLILAPGTGSGSGLSAVSSDGTLTGDGTSGDPLKVANPFEAADETKLDGIAAGAEANVQADWTETDTNDDSYIKNKPTLGTAAAKDLGGANGVAGLNAQGTLFSSEIPSYITTDTELAAAIAALKGGAPANFDTLKELADAIGLRYNDRGVYGSTSAYAARDVVRHNGGGTWASYIALTTVAAGSAATTEPGVGTAWKTSWYRIGYEEGDPNAITGGSVNNGVLSLTRQSGLNPLALMLGSLDTQTTRVEQAAFQNVASAQTSVELQPVASNPISVVVGEGPPQLLTGVTGNDLTLIQGVYVLDIVAEMRAANVGDARNATVNVSARDAADNSIFAGGVTTSPKVAAAWTPVSFIAIIALAETKAVNLFLNRSSAATQLRNIKAEFFRFGGSSPEVGVSQEVLFDGNFQCNPSQRWKAQNFVDGASDWDNFQFLHIEYAIRQDALLSGFFPITSILRLNEENALANRQWYTYSGTSQTPSAVFLVDQGGNGFAIGKTSDKGQLLFAYASSSAQAPATNKLRVVGINFGRPNVQPALLPHISSFSITSGNTTPVAGAIGTVQYGVAWNIAQSSHVAAARIVGFKGTDANPSSVAVLRALTAAEYAHGAGNVTIPSGVTLAANETYTVRLEVYSAGQTPATDTPRSYQDARITAHAAAAAAYHVGRIQYRSADDTVAKQIARITDFTGDTATSADPPARITINAPDDSNEYQMYLIAKASETQPTGFTSNGLPATNSFYAAQDLTIASVAYKVYLLRQEWRVTDDDNGDFFGVSYA